MDVCHVVCFESILLAGLTNQFVKT